MENKIQEERKKQGLCVYCGKEKARQGKTSCQACSDKLCAKQKAKRINFNSQGLCARCGVFPVSNGKKTCERCRKQARDRQHKYREKATNEHS